MKNFIDFLVANNITFGFKNNTVSVNINDVPSASMNDFRNSIIAFNLKVAGGDLTIAE